MALRACLEISLLVVERRCIRGAAETRVRVALEAKQVHIAHPEHVHICSAVGNMAGLTSFDFDRWVFKYEWPFLLRVTLEADRILRGGRLHLFGLHRAMRVMAVSALN